MRAGNAESDPLRNVLVNFKGAVQRPGSSGSSVAQRAAQSQ